MPLMCLGNGQAHTTQMAGATIFGVAAKTLWDVVNAADTTGTARMADKLVLHFTEVAGTVGRMCHQIYKLADEMDTEVPPICISNVQAILILVATLMVLTATTL